MRSPLDGIIHEPFSPSNGTDTYSIVSTFSTRQNAMYILSSQHVCVKNRRSQRKVLGSHLIVQWKQC